MKKLFIITLFIFSQCFPTTLCFSQESPTTSSEDNQNIKNLKSPTQRKFYFNNEQSLLKVSLKKKFLKINAWDVTKMTKTTSKKHKYSFKFDCIESVIKLNNNFYLIYTLKDNKNKMEQVFARELDPINGSILDKNTLLFTYDGKIDGPKISPNGARKISIFNIFSLRTKKLNTDNYSFDKTKLLIQFKVKPEVKSKKKNYDKIGYYVFNENLNLLSGGVVEMPYTEKKMVIKDYSIDATGNVYTLAKVFEDGTKEKKKDDTPNYNIELLKITPKTKQLKISKIELENKFINDLKISENSLGNIVCAGFYYKDLKNMKNNISNGIFTFKLGINETLENVAYFEFPAELINQAEHRKILRKNKKATQEQQSNFNSLKINKLIVQKDGSYIVIGEQDYIVRHSSYSEGRTEIKCHFYYNSVLISKINNEGELEWMRKLPKFQLSVNKPLGGLSFAYLKGPKDHYIVFVDNKKNQKLSIDQHPKIYIHGKTGLLCAYKINDNKGDVSKHYLYNKRKVQGIFNIKFSRDRVFQISPTHFVTEFNKLNKNSLLLKEKLP